MATIDTLTVKLNVEMLGLEELDHLLGALKANVDVLPTVVVRALEALAATATQEDAANV